MASNAFTNRLLVVLADADEINNAHNGLRTGRVGRQYGLGALNRAVVVMCVSAWEAYIEELVKECLGVIKPNPPLLGVWPALNASARSQVGRFNNPNVQNTRDLIRNSIGLEDVTTFWKWGKTPPARACERLEEAIKLRHHIAHGVTPRPIVHNQQYASRLPKLFQKLGQKTDKGVSDYMASELGVIAGW